MSRIVNHTMTKIVVPHDVSHHKSARRAIYVRLSGDRSIVITVR
jgi:hypothetical protein